MNRIGRFWSQLVFQNIAGLIGLGLFRVLFGERGWFPLPAVNHILDPMLKYFLPLLFAYTGGKMIADHRGGVIASFVMVGLIAGNNTAYSMLLPAMLIGPLMGWIIAYSDNWLKDRIPVGLELLCYNVSAGFIGLGFSLFSYLVVADWFEAFMNAVHMGADRLLHSNYLPLIALAIEPGKVLFLNNMINHGILEPLGIQLAKELGQSNFFLLETNPGPGIGLMLAYYFRLKGKEKDNVRSLALVQFIGGIHEVYFPYALMRPIVIVPLIAAGLIGDWIFVSMHAGLVATPSPGSIIILMLMAPKGMHVPVICGVLASGIVSFLGTSYVLSRKVGTMTMPSGATFISKKQPDVEISEALPGDRTIRKIYFACDAGMGSSAMGAAILRKKFKRQGIPIDVGNCSVDRIPGDADLVISQARLTKRAKEKFPHIDHLSIPSFVEDDFFDELMMHLRHRNVPVHAEEVAAARSTAAGEELFTEEYIRLGGSAVDQWQAIRQMGDLLVDMQLVQPAYVHQMIKREIEMSTYIGNGVALPHGIDGSEPYIEKAGIVIGQYPDGVEFEDNRKAYLLIAVIGGERQADLMARIAYMVENKDTVSALIDAKTKRELYEAAAPYIRGEIS